jgi:pimeloyl-ACP methyl ester carboxylesterase
MDPTRSRKTPFWPAEEGIARGYAMAAFHNAEVDPDRDDGFKDGAHGLLDEGPRSPDSWGTIAAWAWGASRVMDYLVTDAGVAKDRVAVIGHSRGGKTALWAAAQDERFAMAVSNDSGCTGASLSRRRFLGKEQVARITQAFPHWFCSAYRAYAGKEDDLPVDQHQLLALIAPRALAVGSADQDLWADPRGEFLSLAAAEPAFRLLGRKGFEGRAVMPGVGGVLRGDGMQYHLREGKHDLTLSDWQRYWDLADREFSR